MADNTQNILINIDLETGDVVSKLDEINKKTSSLGDNVNTQSFKSVRAEINATREEAVKLAIAIEKAEEAGENVDELTKRYTETTQKAAQLRDAVDKANDSISNADPDNRLKGLIGVAQGAITAVQGIAGAFTLIGVDAETAQVAIAKLQGIIALTDAIGSIDKIIDGYKDLRNIINFTTIAQRASNLVTVAAVAIQKAFTGSVLATGGAFRLLKIAIAATGIGLLVVAIGFAVSKIMEWVDSSNEAEEATAALTEEINKLTEAYEKEAAIQSRANRLLISELKARGATEKELNKARLEGLQEQARLAEENFQKIDARRRTAVVITQDLQDQINQAQTQLDNARFEVLIARNEIRANDLNGEKKLVTDKGTLNRDYTDDRKNEIKELNDFIEQQRLIERQRFQTDLQNEIDNVNKKYERIIKLAQTYRKSTVEIERLRAAEIKAITDEELIRAEEFGITQTLELVKNKVTLLGNEINQEVKAAINNTKDADEVRKQITSVIISRNKEISSIFQLGAQLRLRQAQIERDARLKAVESLTFASGTDPQSKELNDKRRATIKRVIEEDFELQTKQISDEINNAEQSLRKGIEITLLEVNVAESKNQVDRIIELFNKLLVPFRTIAKEDVRKQLLESGEEYIKSFGAGVRRGLTSIDIEEEIKIEDKFAQAVAAQRKVNEETLKSRDIESKEARLEIEGQYIKDRIRLDDEYNKLVLSKLVSGNILITDEERSLLDETLKIEEEKNRKINDLDVEDFANRASLINEQNNIIRDLETKQGLEILKIRQPLSSFQPGESSFARNFLSSENAKKQFDSLLKTTGDYYSALTDQENAQYQKELADLKFRNESTEELERGHTANLVKIQTDYKNDLETINLSIIEGKVQLYDTIGFAISNLGRLFNENTAVAKSAALAEIAIGIGAGYVRGLDIAQKSAAAKGPGAAYAFPIFYAQQIAAVLGAAAKAKQILSTVKGPSGGSGSTGTVSPPQNVQPINSSVFNLQPQAQDVRITNAQSQVVRAYITNEDLRSAQEKQAFLNKLSGF